MHIGLSACSAWEIDSLNNPRAKVLVENCGACRADAVRRVTGVVTVANIFDIEAQGVSERRADSHGLREIVFEERIRVDTKTGRGTS